MKMDASIRRILIFLFKKFFNIHCWLIDVGHHSLLKMTALISFCQLDPNWSCLGSGNLSWGISCIRWACGHECGTFSILMMDARMPRLLSVVPPLSRWSWEVQENKVSKSPGVSQWVSFLHSLLQFLPPASFFLELPPRLPPVLN